MNLRIFASLALTLTWIAASIAQYDVGEQALYLANWDDIIKDSYSVPLPNGLKCKNNGFLSNTANLPQCTTGDLDLITNTQQITNAVILQVTISSNMDATKFQTTCGKASLCVIQAGVTVTINGNIDVAAIVNRGTIQWDDNSQTTSEQWLCAGYIVTEDDGVFSLAVTNSKKTAYIYIKNNRAFHPAMGARAFGAHHGHPTKQGFPKVLVQGHPLRRTWSVLGETVESQSNVIDVAHDVETMGWKVGDRIAIAPTQRLSAGTAQTFYIKSISGTAIHLAADSALKQDGYTNQKYMGDSDNYMQAEVLMLKRNVVITGDDFEQYPCSDGDPTCPCRFGGLICTVGLHTAVNGTNERYGGTLQMQYTRVEKCGQRGSIGRYCVHMHLVRDCKDCLVKGNVVEFSQQRGVVIHGTHMSTVTENTLYDVRGAGIYIEDGNEMYNHVEYNAVVCPWPFTSTKGGCTIPGTDNDQADTEQNQAAYWSISHTNHFIGNRAANSFNGVFFQPSFNVNGRGLASGRVCTQLVTLGRVEGNTMHSHARFGTYFVSSDWPKQVGRTVEGNGFTTNDMCVPFNADGTDRGAIAAIQNNVDYFNAFVGSYHMGDIQFRNHISISNDNLIYHKETKNFADGCAAHYKNFHFEDGRASLASGLGTQIFEDSTFKGNFIFETDHHCNLGTSGVLCNPQYIFVRPVWEVTSEPWLTWNEPNNPTRGGIYNLSPEDAANPQSDLFPPGFQGLVHSAWTYLLNVDNGQTCVTSASLGLAHRYENGILCKKPIRRLEIFTLNQTASTVGTAQLQVSKAGNLMSTGVMRWTAVPDARFKQGFTIPVLASLDYNYRVVRNGGIPQDWIIEFSDPVIGNRWSPDQVRLQVDGRTCPDITTSQHDRRFIYSDDTHAFQTPGRGACSQYPEMPRVDCSTVPDIPLMNCPGLCQNCTGTHQYCDCGSAQCKCEAGFYGGGCQSDICAPARCGSNGKCSARYLGGDVPVAVDACICLPPYAGPTCEANPCVGVDCGIHGSCMAIGETSFYCECEAGYTGARCESTCNGFCAGDFPYRCSLIEPTPSLCNRYGGCSYNGDFLGSPDWCCYANCFPICPDPCVNDNNDCTVPSVCVNGTCSKETVRIAGSVCNSQPWGVCEGGVCVAGVPIPPASSESDVTNDGGKSSLGTSLMISALSAVAIMLIALRLYGRNLKKLVDLRKSPLASQ